MTRYVRISTPSRSASERASAFGRTLKPTIIALDADASITSPSVISPAPLWMTLTRTSGCSDLLELADGRLDRADHVALEHEVEILRLALLEPVEDVLEAHPPPRLPRLSVRRSRSPRVCAEWGGALVLDDARARVAAGVGRSRGSRPARPAAPRGSFRRGSCRAPAPSPTRVAGHDGVADRERATVDEHRCDRAATDVQARLDDRAGGFGVRVGLELELGVGDQQDALQQVVEVLALLGGDLGVLRRPAPLFRLKLLGGELAFTRSGLAAGRSILLTATTIGTSAAGVRDRLLRLWHDAVVGGDDEHGDVRHLGAARTHGA